MMTVVLWSLYGLCVILCYGLTFAARQRQYPEYAESRYRLHMIESGLFALSGPLGILSLLSRVMEDGYPPFHFGIKFV